MSDLPVGWTLGFIDDIAKVTSGGTPSRKEPSYWNGDIPWVTTAEVKFGTITETEQKITQNGLDNSSAKLFPIHTILMAMYGQGKTRGQVAKLGITAATNQACAALLLKDGFCTDYYYQYLISQYENIRDLANSGGQKNLSAGIIKSIPVPLPPLPEQCKIAQILSTWDKAIVTTEKQIANSKQQKKALMQQLLTGKKRLAGFSGDWDVVKLGDVFSKVSNGLTYDTKLTQGLPVSRIETISTGEINYQKIGYASNTEKNLKFRLKKGDILYSHINSLEHIGRVAYFYDESPLYHGMNLLLLRSSERINTKFIYYVLSSFIGKKLAKNYAKSAVNQASISTTDLKSFSVEIPCKQEQQKIAQVLTTADNEISTLETQLTHLQQEKKALMQQLLTGKRRVLVD